jgi:hypothetical protein
MFHDIVTIQLLPSICGGSTVSMGLVIGDDDTDIYN